MARQKKGKARVQLPAPGGGEEQVGLAPIPENPAGHEGWGNHTQGGEAWQNQEGAWPDAGADDNGYAPQEDQWAYDQGQQTGGWDNTQYQQQDWGPPTNSPAVNTTVPAGAPAWAAWGRKPEGAYGTPRAPRAATTQQYAAPPPQAMPSYHLRHDNGANTGAVGWQNWGKEAAANGYQPSPQSQRAPGPGTSYGQQYRAPYAGNDPYAHVAGDRADMDPHAQRAIFESILSSRGGAPKQPQQRSARKQSKKSKKERRTQEQSAPNDWGGQQGNQGWAQGNQGWRQENQGWEQENQGWEQENQGWEQENQGWEQENQAWDKEGTGWARQDAEQGGKEAAWDQWDNTGAEGAKLDGDGYTDSEGWNDVTGRRGYRQTVENAFVPRPVGDSPYPMASRTMAYASGHAQDSLDAFSPGLSRLRNTIHDYANMEFLDSDGEAFKPAWNAFFGRDRKARDRIHWQFPHDKDERVRRALEWLHDNAHGVGAFGLNKFLQTRERGALFINASYDLPASTGPALDWLDYDLVVETRDRLMQESVGFYDPAVQVMVFVYLPSKSGNSLAMWRRKVVVPSSVRLAHPREIELAKAALRREYPVLVDELRPLPYRPSSLPPPSMKKKKKGFFRRLFRIFKIVW